jgi:pimeloyl-ACP methyl ester carboxylesterase
MRPVLRNLLLALAACLPAAGCALDNAVTSRTPNECMGVLLNYSCGAHPCDPIDPSKPTLVFTHGWNPLPNRIRSTFGQASAAALRCRCGDSYNLMSWDWNAVRVPVPTRAQQRISRDQGRKLAAALRARGVVPARTQIIAHSLGTVATAQAAYCLSDLGPFAQLTLLDSPASMHEVIFDELCITHHAHCIENYWAPGTAGYGAHVERPKVKNYIVHGPHPIWGTIDLSRSSHVHVMLWYYNTIACPTTPYGFQKSVFVHCCGRGRSAVPPDSVPPEYSPEPAIETALLPSAHRR